MAEMQLSPDFCIAAPVDDCRVPETGGADILRHEHYQDVLATAATLGNYVEVFTRVNMMKFILNSLFYVFVIVILDLAVNSVCGYALANSISPERSCC